MSEDTSVATTPPLDAIELALALYRAPRRADQVRHQPLPSGVDLLLRVAGGDERAMEDALATGAKRGDIVDAARFFVQQALVTHHEDPYRVLGVPRDAPLATIKEHHRLLIRFLHPDRSDGSGLDVYAERINRSWNALRTPERRAETDARLRKPESFERTEHDPRAAAPVFARTSEPVAMRAPIAGLAPWILGTTALIALGVVAWAWLESDQQRAAQQSAPAAAAGASVEPLASGGGAIDAQLAPADGGIALPPDGSAIPEGDSMVGPPEAPAALDASATVEIVGVGGITPGDTADSDLPPASEPVPSDRVAASDTGADQTSAASPDTSSEAITESPAPPDTSARAAAIEPAAPVVVDEPASDPDDEARAAEAAADFASAAATSDVESLGREQAEAVLADFSAAYSRGDLATFMNLFAADARNNRGGVEAIAEDYRKFFAGSGTRRIVFDDIEVVPDRDRAITTARFAAEIWPADRGKPQVVSGRIQFDLRREAQRVVIERLLHRENRSATP